MSYPNQNPNQRYPYQQQYGHPPAPGTYPPQGNMYYPAANGGISGGQPGYAVVSQSFDFGII